MGVEQYKTALDQGRRLNDTLIHKLFESHVALGRCLTDEDGTVDYSKLKDEKLRKQATGALYQVLQQHSIARWKSGVTSEFDLQELTFVTFGMDLEILNDYLGGRAEKFNPLEFMAFAQQKTAFGYFMRRNAEGRAKGELQDKDAADVVAYTKTKGKIDSAKLSIEEMAELLNEYIKEGTITASFLQDKKYLLEKKPEAKAENEPN